MMTCAEMAEKLGRAAALAGAGLNIPTGVVMEHAAKEAKRVIGSYEYGWPQLSLYTQEDRVQRGYSANDPLLRTGNMRGSIETKTEEAPGGAEGLVYSEQKEALWAEMGTMGPGRGQPPRSFLFKSLWLASPFIAKTFGTFAEKLFK